MPLHVERQGYDCAGRTACQHRREPVATLSGTASTVMECVVMRLQCTSESGRDNMYTIAGSHPQLRAKDHQHRVSGVLCLMLVAWCLRLLSSRLRWEYVSVIETYSGVKSLQQAKDRRQAPGLGGWRLRNPRTGLLRGGGRLSLSLPLFLWIWDLVSLSLCIFFLSCFLLLLMIMSLSPLSLGLGCFPFSFLFFSFSFLSSSSSS